MRDEIKKAEQAWQELCDAEGKETIELATHSRDLFQMGFNAGIADFHDRCVSEYDERINAINDAIAALDEAEALRVERDRLREALHDAVEWLEEYYDSIKRHQSDREQVDFLRNLNCFRALLTQEGL